jgi:hypothetical protein
MPPARLWSFQTFKAFGGQRRFNGRELGIPCVFEFDRINGGPLQDKRGPGIEAS